MPTVESSLTEIVYDCGKRVSRSNGAGSAINVIVPTSATPVSSPLLTADVFRIDEMKEMVDLVAKNSAMCEEMFVNCSCLKICAPSIWRSVYKSIVGYRFIDGTPINNIVGETSLSVRYQGVIVDLPRVAVLKIMVYPLVVEIE